LNNDQNRNQYFYELTDKRGIDMDDSIYDINKQECPNLDDFPNKNNGFLKSIWDQAHNRELSDKQIWAANKAYDNILHPPIKVKLSQEDRTSLIYVITKFAPSSNYYHKQEFLDDMVIKLENSQDLTDKQYAAIVKKLEHYKNSILRKIFGDVKKR